MSHNHPYCSMSSANIAQRHGVMIMSMMPGVAFKDKILHRIKIFRQNFALNQNILSFPTCILSVILVHVKMVW